MKGTEDFNQCFSNMIKQYSHCNTKCFPILYNYLKELPPCNTSEDVQCIFDSIAGHRQDRYKCLHLKQNVQYDTNFFFNAEKQSNETGFKFGLYFDKTNKDIKEEILMVTIEDFIGSIGGSLGLFLGFSCFTYVSGLLDKLFS